MAKIQIKNDGDSEKRQISLWKALRRGEKDKNNLKKSLKIREKTNNA